MGEGQAEGPPCSLRPHDKTVVPQCAQLRTHLPTPFNGRWGEGEKGKKDKPVDSPCSRNARAQTPLVGRAHIGMDQANPQKVEYPHPLIPLMVLRPDPL